ncbi:MAG TPA: glycoside hydrolase family 3 N-terminal domain-containing protein [Polyangiaceae bacterium]|nr:glycoside hydrolase family 3 N-terminal domain-containing protein [Polyangiaceae bacterium]
MVPALAAPLYRDPSQNIETRIDDLLHRMTLAEKIGQMLQLDGRSDAVAQVLELAPGSLLHILNEELGAAMDAAARTRLGIPLLIGEDAIHGHAFHPGATVFPTQLGLACSWDVELLCEVARITAVEMSTTGAHWTFSPVLCIARDPRWGRVGETFGEDPFLIGELGAAMIEGYQGEGLSDARSVLATAKHYAGYSETQGGRDASEADISRRKLRSYFLPPFERAARAGCRAFMTGYQSMDGLPSTANRWLLTEVLKEQWGFTGIVVTDWDNVGRLHWGQRIVPSLVEAAVVAVRCGNDLIMVTPGFHAAAQLAVERGLLDANEIDAVVRRILRLKFELGLFENPRRPDRAAQARLVGTAEHRHIALRAARECLVLLRNDGVLPLERAALRRIALIGPNADNDLAQLGDWSLGSTQYPPEHGKQPRELTVTLLDGVRAAAGAVEVGFARGCSVNDDDLSGVAAAVKLAREADVAVVVLGDDIPYNGETRSTATLELMGGQRQLLDAIAESGASFVLVLVSGKPLILPQSAQRAKALVQLFNPGMLGGTAFAEALFGELNPSGKLPMSFPRHVGQCPVFYNQLPLQHGNRYADLTQEPAFVFGFGLSYTQYTYSDLRLLAGPIAPGQPLVFEVLITNAGARDGVETVQAYVRDLVTSVTWPDKMLAAFARVELRAGEGKTVRLEIPFEQLSLIDAFETRCVEPGEFELLVGSSSRDADLLAARFEVAGPAFSLDRIPGLTRPQKS